MALLNDLIPPIRDNLFGYDMLIIFIAIGTLAYFMFILLYTGKVYKAIYIKAYLPDDINDEEEKASKSDIKKNKARLRGMRETSEKYYSMFVTLTGIFPLLGILGTVISLIPLVQDIQNMQASFFVALTSTLWGLVFAVFFKILDGMLYPRIERNNRGIDDYLEALELKLKEIKSNEKK